MIAIRNRIFTRTYNGEALPAMHVPPPVFKPQTPKQRGVQPNKALPSQNQWFTKAEAAAHCIAAAKSAMHKAGKNWRNYTVVEPSAGDGRFYNLLPPRRRIGVDLAPQIPGVARHNYLQWRPPRRGKYVVIGNPPFGVRGNLADAFIRRSALFADVCAFILPVGYGDPQRSYFPGFELIHSEELPGNIFVNVLGHESKCAGQGAINTVFNVWAASTAPPPPRYDYICNPGISVAACNFPKDPAPFIQRHNWFVKARYYGRTKSSARFDDCRSRNSHYVIGIGAGEKHLRRIRQIDWSEHHNKALNGSFSISLKSARRALHGIGLAQEVVKSGSENGSML